MYKFNCRFVNYFVAFAQIVPSVQSRGKKCAKTLVLLLCLHAFLGCSSSSTLIEGKPGHHTTKGFRNYPSVSAPVSKDFLFYMRRVLDSFFLPEVSNEHFLSEKEAIANLKLLEDKNTITWLGHSTFLLRIDGKTILQILF